MHRLKFVACADVFILMFDACTRTCTHGRVHIIDALCVVFR